MPSRYKNRYSFLPTIITLFLSTIFQFTNAQQIDTIIVHGDKFYNNRTREPFFIKGVAYQPRENGKIYDPVTDSRHSAWERDLALWKELGVNTVRIYEIDPTKSHDKFMKAAADAGIYLMFDLGQAKSSLNRLEPVYTLELLEQYKATVDAIAKYDNVLGLFAGNEVVNEPGSTTKSAPFMKALIRDLKSHMRTKSRYVPIGYATNDDSKIRLDIASYFVCDSYSGISGQEETQEDSKIDFLGYNLYSWCGESGFVESGWADRTKEYEGYPVPVILSEFGCNEIMPRVFREVKSMFGPEMMDVFAGGIAYEYSEEDNNYGLVKIKSNGTVEKLKDFFNLKKAYADANPQVRVFSNDAIHFG